MNYQFIPNVYSKDLTLLILVNTFLLGEIMFWTGKVFGLLILRVEISILYFPMPTNLVLDWLNIVSFVL